MIQGEDNLTHTAYIALGSNIGDREAYLCNALLKLNEQPGIQIEAVSKVYETDPVGEENQAMFLNMAAKVQTTLSPKELLRCMLQAEKALGRTRELRWGPRTIDLDLLLYERLSIQDFSEPGLELELPHPRMLDRAFVLIPLLDILPLDQSKEASAALDGLAGGKEGIRLWTAEPLLPSEFARFAN